MTLEYLYFFSSPDFDLVECKRTDLPANAPKSSIYKWLGYSRFSDRIVEFDFHSMRTVGRGEHRDFQEGCLDFGDHHGHLSFLGKTFQLAQYPSSEIPETIKAAVSRHLSENFEREEKFCFRRLKPSDISFFREWVFDEETIRYSLTRFHRFSSEAQVDSWYRDSLFDPNTFQLGIVDPKAGKLLGYAGVAGINKIDKNGEYFIFIGDKRYWRQGIGSQVTKRLIGIAFKSLELHRIGLTVSSQNISGIKAYESAGFCHEGQMRDAFFRNGEFSDKLVMGILSGEFKSPG